MATASDDLIRLYTSSDAVALGTLTGCLAPTARQPTRWTRV
jgi:hypothetical protein